MNKTGDLAQLYWQEEIIDHTFHTLIHTGTWGSSRRLKGYELWIISHLLRIIRNIFLPAPLRHSRDVSFRVLNSLLVTSALSASKRRRQASLQDPVWEGSAGLQLVSEAGSSGALYWLEIAHHLSTFPLSGLIPRISVMYRQFTVKDDLNTSKIWHRNLLKMKEINSSTQN